MPRPPTNDDRAPRGRSDDVTVDRDMNERADSQPSPREVRVFVSSTFKDMQVERDELSARAFMELRQICEERGVAWTDVDLRWGITDEQTAEGEVLPICLAEIESCRPFFIGILGERYGWIPEELPGDEVEREPWLADDPERSITAVEIAHGVLNSPSATEHAFFYFRDPAYVASLPRSVRGDFEERATHLDTDRLGAAEAERRAGARRARLAELKERIRASEFPVSEYHEPHELSSLVARDLKGVIDRLYPAEAAPSPRARETQAHEAMLREVQRAFVSRPQYAEGLDAFAAADGPPLVIVGDTGVGKTSLLGNWVAERRDATGEQAVVHFVGASPASASWDSMVRRVIVELSGRSGTESNGATSVSVLRRELAATLQAAAAGRRRVVVVDGLDQLDDRDQALDLAWLPHEIPANIRLVLSTRSGRPLDEIRRRSWPTLALAPLQIDEQEELLVDYLALYGKRLSRAHRDRIIAGHGAANPLFLRTLLDELRFHGEYETLGRAIDHYSGSGVLADLYSKVLVRLERDYERNRPALVRDAMRATWAAHRGLTEDELLDHLGPSGQRLPRALFAPLHRAARQLLVDRAGFLGPGHDELRSAIVARYLATDEQQTQVHLSLARYFDRRPASPRRVEELPWQLSRARAWDELANLLSDLDFLEQAWLADQFEVRRYWAEVEEVQPGRVLLSYREALENPPGDRTASSILANLLVDFGYWEEALRLLGVLAAAARRRGDQAALLRATVNEAHVLQKLGRWGDALTRYEEQAALAADLGEWTVLAAAFGGQALVHGKRGHPQRALELLMKEERLHREHDDDAALQACLGNQAQVMTELGDHRGAMEVRKEQERIARETGRIDGVASSIDGQAVLLLREGALGDALALNHEAQRLYEQLGNQAALATVLTNRAAILQELGRSVEALAALEEAERTCRAIGEQQDLVTILENQAVIQGDLGRYGSALELFAETEATARRLGYALGLEAALANHARLLVQGGEARAALDLLDEAVAVSQEAGHHRVLAECLNLMGSALMALGLSDEAEAVWQRVRDLIEEHGLGHR